jgi:DNA modification methylase
VDEALRADLAVQLLEHLTREGDPVIDPVLGDGATLLAAEATGRTCWGAEPDPQRCGRIIRAWERLTGETAVPSPVLSNRVA